MSTVYKLKVLEVKKETSDAVSVAFDVPYELYETFSYKSGQYVTLQFTLNNEQVRRSYSLCSNPLQEEPLKIGVKRVENGLVSNHINDTLKAGDVVEVLPPDGHFFANIQKKNYKTYYLFAAGSGITPMLSILKTVLFVEEKSYVSLLYGNTNQETILFKEELEMLQQQFPERLIVKHCLSKPKSSFWSLKNKMDYRKGRINETTVHEFINQHPPYAQNAEYYICGPGNMIANTVKALQNIDVPNVRIFKESFGIVAKQTINKGVEASLIAILNDEKIKISIPKGKTILRALLTNNYNPPYSCEGGVCSSCICKLEKGEVFMKKNLALTIDEVKQGYILSCQSVPLTKEISVTFD